MSKMSWFVDLPPTRFAVPLVRGPDGARWVLRLHPCISICVTVSLYVCALGCFWDPCLLLQCSRRFAGTMS